MYTKQITRFVENLNQVGGDIINEADNQRELAGRMQQLAERAGNNREVLQSIYDIADQTNSRATVKFSTAKTCSMT